MNNDHKSAILNFIKVTFFQGIYIPPLELHILFYGNVLATWYGFPDIMHFEVENCRMSAIFNLIKLTFLRTYPYLKRHLLFNSICPVIWHDFPVIEHIKGKSGHRLVILNLIKLTFFTVYLYL